jgi:hypothetical protein
MRWMLDQQAQDYKKAADDMFLWRCRRLLLPGETIEKFVDRVCGDD